MGNELDFFIKQVDSNLARARQGKVIYMPFIDEQKQEMLRKKNPIDVKIILFGGFIDAEYKRVIFVPEEFKSYNSKVKIYQIIYNTRYLTLHHRKVLGALLNLGIERSSIGDILFIEEKVYFACTEEISLFIQETFKTISGIPIEIIEVKESIRAIKNLKIEQHILSSLRLDTVLASAYRLSRADASSIIMDGLVMVNHVECKNISKQIGENDIISVRHKGRFCLTKIDGRTRSERIKVTLSFYI